MPKKPTPQTIELEPFPKLSWDTNAWVGELRLASWQGFRSSKGAYGGIRSRTASRDDVTLSITNKNRTATRLPTREQVKAFQYVMKRDAALQRRILTAIFKLYPSQREQYGHANKPMSKVMPELKEPDELKALIGLTTVHILPVYLADIAYIGFEFGCTWDAEHGLGVMMHRQRVIDVGGADSAFLDWIAEGDAKTQRKKMKR